MKVPTDSNHPGASTTADDADELYMLYLAEYEEYEQWVEDHRPESLWRHVTFEEWRLWKKLTTNDLSPDPATEYLKGLSQSHDESQEELNARRHMIDILTRSVEGGLDKPVPAPHPAVYHGLAGDVVHQIAPHTEASEMGLLLTFLTMFGNAVGPGAYYVADGIHPPRLYVAIVGESSRGRKQATWYHLYNLFEEADPTWALDRIKSGLSTGEGLGKAVQGEENAGDGRLLLREPELSRVLAIARRDGSTASAILRDLWDSDRISILRREDPVDASGIHLSLVGHITPEELREKLDRTDILNGFANRFLFALVERSKLLPEGGTVPGNTRADLAKKVRKAIRRAGKLTATRMERDDVATAMWDEIYQMVDLRHNRVSGLWGAATARAEAQMTRLQVIYALLDGSALIRREHVEAAWYVWEYCDWSAGSLFAATTGDSDADKLLRAIVQAGKTGLSHSEQYELFGRNKTKDELLAMRDRLAELELIRETEVYGEKGRPKNVSVSTKFELAE